MTLTSKHQLAIGGVMSKLYGEEETDFAEIHVVYSIPFQ